MGRSAFILRASANHLAFEFGDDLLEVGQILGQTIQPVNDHHNYQPTFDIGRQGLEPKPKHAINRALAESNESRLSCPADDREKMAQRLIGVALDSSTPLS